MKKWISMLLLWLGLSTSWLQSQSVSLDNFQDIQLMKNEFCAVIEVNASWNWANRIALEKIDKCYTGYVDLSNKQIGAVIQKEWDITVVPTIIIFEYGVEVKREGRYLNMYDVQSYESKVGFNWLIY